MIVIYSLCIVGGPTVAPVIGSAVSESYLTWRWTQYIVVILAGVVLLLNFFFLPETSSATILTKKARQLRLSTKRWSLHSKHEEMDHSLSGFLHKTLFLPLQMLVKEPMVLLITLYLKQRLVRSIADTIAQVQCVRIWDSLLAFRCDPDYLWWEQRLGNCPCLSA